MMQKILFAMNFTSMTASHLVVSLTKRLTLLKVLKQCCQRRILQAIPLDSIQNLDFQRDTLPTKRSLGFMWDLQKDALTFFIFPPEKPFTRRGVLSVINSIYDPLGFATPVT